MISPTGIIPEEFMRAERWRDVVTWLLNAPLAGNVKRQLLRGWEVEMGTRVPIEYAQAVENSNYTPPA